MATNRSLRALREQILISHAYDVIDSDEFVLLYDANSQVCFEAEDATCFSQKTQTLSRPSLFGVFQDNKKVCVVTSKSTYYNTNTLLSFQILDQSVAFTLKSKS